MTLLFIPQILNKDFNAIYSFLGVVAFILIIVFLAMMIDLHYGMKKAKKMKEFISSDGMKRTIMKVKDYYSALLFAFFADIVISVFTYFLPFPLNIVPIITLCVAFIQLWTEFKSVKEKGEDKVWRNIEKSASEVSEFYSLLKKDGIRDEFMEFIKNKQNNV